MEISEQYCLSKMDKNVIMARLREKGGRVTRQRKILLDIILSREFSNCKEIYYDAIKVFPKIGMATIYRTVNTLEEIGALHKRNIYCIKNEKPLEVGECLIELADGSTMNFNAESLKKMLEREMEDRGFLKGRRVNKIYVKK